MKIVVNQISDILSQHPIAIPEIGTIFKYRHTDGHWYEKLHDGTIQKIAGLHYQSDYTETDSTKESFIKNKPEQNKIFKIHTEPANIQTSDPTPGLIADFHSFSFTATFTGYINQITVSYNNSYSINNAVNDIVIDIFSFAMQNYQILGNYNSALLDTPNYRQTGNSGIQYGLKTYTLSQNFNITAGQKYTIVIYRAIYPRTSLAVNFSATQFEIQSQAIISYSGLYVKAFLGQINSMYFKISGFLTFTTRVETKDDYTVEIEAQKITHVLDTTDYFFNKLKSALSGGLIINSAWNYINGTPNALVGNFVNLLNSLKPISFTASYNDLTDKPQLSGTNTGDETANSIISKIGDGSKISSTYLPSYVDDVVEVTNYSALPITGENGKIYITLSDNKQYRWTGSIYVLLVASPGTTDEITEGQQNKFFTENRVLASILSSFATASSRIPLANTQSVVTAINVISKWLTDLGAFAFKNPSDANISFAEIVEFTKSITLNSVSTNKWLQTDSNKKITEAVLSQNKMLIGGVNNIPTETDILDLGNIPANAVIISEGSTLTYKTLTEFKDLIGVKFYTKLLTEATDTSLFDINVSNNTVAAIHMRFAITATYGNSNKVHYSDIVVIVRNENGIISSSISPHNNEISLPNDSTKIIDTILALTGTAKVTIKANITSGTGYTSYIVYFINQFLGSITNI